MNKKVNLIASQQLGKVKHLGFFEDRFVGLNGKETTMGLVRHPGAVVILPRLANGDLILIKQHRYVVDDFIYEFPAGSLDRQVESPQSCAQREIVEETGYQATTWQDLGTLLPAPGFTDELQYLYFAEDLTPATAEQDEDEIIEVHSFAVDTVKEMIAANIINDAKSIAIFYRALLAGLIS